MVSARATLALWWSGALETGGGSKMGIGHLGPHPRLVANYGIR